MPRRVLVVDDSEHLRQLLGLHIEWEDALVVCGEATNGAEAVQAALQQRPDAVILDQEMPVLDGLGALAAIREALPQATIVMFSSATGTSTRKRAQALGADAFFDKAADDVGRVIAYLAGPRRSA